MCSYSHNAICFKYAHRKNRSCQFDFPHQIINVSFVGLYRVIKLKRNDS